MILAIVLNVMATLIVAYATYQLGRRVQLEADREAAEEFQRELMAILNREHRGSGNA